VLTKSAKWVHLTAAGPIVLILSRGRMAASTKRPTPTGQNGEVPGSTADV